MEKAKLEAEAEAKAKAEAEEKTQKEAEEKADIEFRLRCDRWEADKQNLLKAEEEFGKDSDGDQTDGQNQADDLNQTGAQNPADDTNQTDDQNPAGDTNPTDEQNPAGDANQATDQPQAEEQPQDTAEPQKEDAATAKAGTDFLTQALKDSGITDPYAYVRTISKAEGKTSILATLNGANYQIDVTLEGNTINQVTVTPC